MLNSEKRLLDILEINTFKLKKLYLRDTITELPNLRYLTEHPDECLKGQKRVAILVVDLRRVKNIKAVFGYRFIEKLYKAVANKLKTVQDILCLITLHGGRFVVITYVDKAKSVAEDILNSLTGKPLNIEKNVQILVTANIGIIFYPDKETDSLLDAIRLAELATEKSKEKGLNIYMFFEKDFIKEVKENERLEELLREYQVDGKLHDVVYPVFQIRVDAQTEQPSGAEILMRLKNVPNIGKAVSILEETGLLKDFFPVLVGQSLPFMEKALNLIPNFTFSFNISPVQLYFLETQLADFMNLIFSSSVDSKNIELEVTETSLLEDKKIIEQFNAFTELGFKIAIDDFGKGYSSFDRILSLKATTIKLDKKLIDFVSNTTDKNTIQRHNKFLKNLVRLLKDLDFFVVAEGVENAYQVQFLRKIGVDQIQGFYYAKPVEGEKFLNCLKNWEKQKKCK